MAAITTQSFDPDRTMRQVRRRISMLEDPMPISKYDRAFGGKKGSALKAMQSMQKSYGPKKGTSVFYATKNKRGKKSSMAAMQRY